MEEISKQQQFLEIVEGDWRYILVEAPAGTGKTYSCIQAAKQIIQSNTIEQHQKILILTFSRNARAQLIKEMSKIDKSINLARRVEINNYHSFFKKYLDSYRDVIGIEKELLIVDDVDYMEKLSIFAVENELTYKSKINMNIIDDYLINGNEIIQLNEKTKHSAIPIEDKKAFINCSLNFTRKTGTVCFAQFGALIHSLLVSSSRVEKAISHDFPILILDEYQDTNYYQEHFVRKILSQSKGIFFADKFQMIYDFRGSTKSRIDDMPTIFPELKYKEFDEYHRYKGKDDLIEILTSIRNYEAPDYSKLKNGCELVCNIECEPSWQKMKGASHKRQCTIFSKAVLFKCISMVSESLSQNKSVAILCRTNVVANRMTELFIEKGFYPKSITDSQHLIQICKIIKMGLEIGTIKEKTPYILAAIAMCDIRNTLNNESVTQLLDYDFAKLSKKRKAVFKNISKILDSSKSSNINKDFLDVILEALDVLQNQKGFFLNNIRRKFIAHCAGISDLEKNDIDRLMIQRQYMDSFTSIDPGLYITTIHQSKGKEFDCVFVVESNSLVSDTNLLYVSHSRMKEKLYPIVVNYLGSPYR